MINIIKWIIIELIILKKNQFILILGTVWQSHRLSYRTWNASFTWWHDNAIICHTVSSSMTMLYIVIPIWHSMTMAWFVIPNLWQYDNGMICHTEFEVAWQCYALSYRRKVVWHYFALSCCFLLNLQVLCHIQLSYRKLYSMTMLQFVILIHL